ncbi:hypothetical protein MLD38_020716 [Melastoma candidum]|nr:hypothetical protein MLD38_020716 [Melastoma candidum]
MSGRKGSLADDSESEDDLNPRRRMKSDFSRRAGDSSGRDSTKRFKSNGKGNRRSGSLDGNSDRILRSDFNREGDGYRGRRMEGRPRSSPRVSNYDNRGGGDRDFSQGRRTGGRPRSPPRSKNYDERGGGDDDNFRNRRRVIER